MNSLDLDSAFLLPLFFVAVTCIGLGVAIGSLLFENNGKEIMQKQAIENNCAQYNPTNGNFEWVKK